MHAHARAHTYTHICIYIKTHTHTHTHSYTPINILFLREITKLGEIKHISTSSFSRLLQKWFLRIVILYSVYEINIYIYIIYIYIYIYIIYIYNRFMVFTSSLSELMEDEMLQYC